jgi:hypothetical protein
MGSDPFHSSFLSLALAWICAIPFLVGGVSALISVVFERTGGVPKPFMLWLLGCVLVVSPFRYIVLQVLLAAAYPVQSFGALFSVIPLAIYVPIVFGLLFMLGVGLPSYIVVLIAAGRAASNAVSRGRLWLAAAVAPFAMAAGYVAFFFALEYGAFSTHWLRAHDVIGATNGPAAFVYSHGLGNLMPLPVAGELTPVVHTDRDMLRAHVASYYLGRREFTRYVHDAYPELYNQRSK